MDIESNNNALVIGYYPFRGKVQVCRLLCEYLHVPYTDRFFTPEEWNSYKENYNQKWVIKDLPFIQDDGFTVTGTSAIIHYILEYAGATDLAGKTLDDKIKMDSFRSGFALIDLIFGVISTSRPTCPAQFKKCMSYYWSAKMLPLLVQIEKACCQGNWFFGYLTVMDFAVYEIVNYLEKLYPLEIQKFTRIRAVRARVSQLPEIAGYQGSERAVTECSPVHYFDEFREEKKKSNYRLNTSVTSSSSLQSHQGMDLE